MKVTNQGGFGTCAVHAFAKCLARGMVQKYDIAVDPNALIQKITTLCDSHRGTTFDQLCNEWNRKIAEKNEGAGIADMDNAVRYWISVDTTTVGTIDQAWQLAHDLQGALCLMCAIKTDEAAHETHAVAIDKSFDDPPDMCGINSWGARKPTIEVNRDNFHNAAVVNPFCEMIAPGTALMRPHRCRTTRSYKDAVRRAWARAMREGREKKVTAGSITVSESLDTTGLRALFGRDFPAWKVQTTERILRKKAEQAEEEAKKRKRVRRECANDVAAAANRHFGGKRLRIAGSLGDGVPEALAAIEASPPAGRAHRELAAVPAPAVRRTRSCP